MLGIEHEKATVQMIGKNLDKIFQHIFMPEGARGSKISAKQTVLISEVCKSVTT